MQQNVEQQINAASLLESLRPSVNGSANALACSKGYSAIQVLHTLHLTCRIAPLRDGDNVVQTTSAFMAVSQNIPPQENKCHAKEHEDLKEDKRQTMKSLKPIYTEKDCFVVKYYHPQSHDYLHYDSKFEIKPENKLPIELQIKFDGTPPLAAPLTPREFKFKAATFFDLHSKLVKWFKMYGYIF